MPIMELPQYSVKPKKARAIVPELLKLLLLSSIFYVGIFLNLSLLEVSLSLSLNLLIILAVVVMIALQSLLSYVSLSKTSYDFYLDRLEITGKRPRTVHYYDVQQPSIKKGFFDRTYKTGTVVIGPKLKLSNVEKPEEVLNYLQDMMAYSQGQR